MNASVQCFQNALVEFYNHSSGFALTKIYFEDPELGDYFQDTGFCISEGFSGCIQ
jgi:hypothetical protein